MAFDIKGYEKLIDSFSRIMIKNKRIGQIRIADDKWTLQEMVGHLIDSASNNHQRFIRLQLGTALDFPAYDAEEWRRITQIVDCDYRFVVSFWEQYNTLLLHLIRNMKESDLNNYWIKGGENKSLGLLIDEYYKHIRWHLDLFNERIKEIKEYK